MYQQQTSHSLINSLKVKHVIGVWETKSGFTEKVAFGVGLEDRRGHKGDHPLWTEHREQMRSD